MAPNPQTKLTTDNVDDLIYACRTGDLDWLQELLKSHSQTLSVSEAAIITSAIDTDEDGLGSQACLLHYPSANGNLEIVTLLLDRLSPPSAASTVDTADSTSPSQPSTANAHGSAGHNSLVNHQNVNGNTPLHWAALNGHIEIVKALVKAGADPTIVNEAGRDAVVEAEYSSKESATDCAHWLLQECGALEQGAGGHIASQEGEASAEEPELEEEREDTQHLNGQAGDKVVPVNGVNGEKHDEIKDKT